MMFMSLNVEKLRSELFNAEATIDLLKGALASEGVQPPEMLDCLVGLSRQARAFVGILYRARARSGPSWVSTSFLLENLPGLDHVEAGDREPTIVSVVARRVRLNLGRQSIESSYGLGYRLSEELYNQLKGGQE